MKHGTHPDKIANGQDIKGPSPAHFITPESGRRSGLGLARANVQCSFGDVPGFVVVAAHRRTPKCFHAARHLGLFFFN